MALTPAAVGTEMKFRQRWKFWETRYAGRGSHEAEDDAAVYGIAENIQGEFGGEALEDCV